MPPEIGMTVWALRFFASVLLLIAVIAAVSDGTRTMAAERLVVTSTGEQWGKIAPNSLKNSQNWVQRMTHPLVWETGVRPLLLLPAWALFGGLGFLLAYIGRRRRRVNVFAN
jgi:hypothetical protein